MHQTKHDLDLETEGTQNLWQLCLFWSCSPSFPPEQWSVLQNSRTHRTPFYKEMILPLRPQPHLSLNSMNLVDPFTQGQKWGEHLIFTYFESPMLTFLLIVQIVVCTINTFIGQKCEDCVCQSMSRLSAWHPICHWFFNLQPSKYKSQYGSPRNATQELVLSNAVIGILAIQ